MLEIIFFLTLTLSYLPAVNSVAAMSLSGWCSESLTHLCKRSEIAQKLHAARPGLQCRRRRNIARIPPGFDCFMNISGRTRGQEESIALDLSLNKAPVVAEAGN